VTLGIGERKSRHERSTCRPAGLRRDRNAAPAQSGRPGDARAARRKPPRRCRPSCCTGSCRDRRSRRRWRPIHGSDDAFRARLDAYSSACGNVSPGAAADSGYTSVCRPWYSPRRRSASRSRSSGRHSPRCASRRSANRSPPPHEDPACVSAALRSAPASPVSWWWCDPPCRRRSRDLETDARHCAGFRSAPRATCRCSGRIRRRLAAGRAPHQEPLHRGIRDAADLSGSRALEEQSALPAWFFLVTRTGLDIAKTEPPVQRATAPSISSARGTGGSGSRPHTRWSRAA